MLAPAALAQTSAHPFGTCAGQSRSGAVVLIPDAPALTVHDAPLKPGDIVAALAPDGSCVGQATWDGSGTALQVWADDPMTPVLDGLLDGDPVVLAVWDHAVGRVYEGADVTPTFSDGLAPDAGFAADALFALARDAERTTAPETTPVAVLDAAYPNPVSHRARIPFRLDAEADVRVEVFDTLGRSVALLADGSLGAGEHTAEFDASDVANGVYVYRLRTGSEVLQGQLIVAR